MTVSGCHTFQPTSIAELTPGQDIRVRVSGAFSYTLSIGTMPAGVFTLLATGSDGSRASAAIVVTAE